MVDDIVDAYVDHKYKLAKRQLTYNQEKLAAIKQPGEGELDAYKPYFQALKAFNTSVQGITLEYDQEEVQKQVIEKLQGQCISESVADEVAAKYDALIDERKSELAKEAKQHNQQVRDSLAQSNEVYLKLEEKRKELEQYSERVIAMCRVYGITSADVQISNGTFTLEELSGLYDKYILYMKKPVNSTNFIRLFRKRVSNVYIQAGIIAACFLLAFTAIYDLLAVCAILFLCFLQSKAAGKVEVYTLLMGLIYNVNPLAMGFKEKVEDEELACEEVSDEDERLEDIVNAYAGELESLSGKLEEYEMVKNETLQELFSKTVEIESIFQKIKKVFEGEKQELLNLIEKRRVEAEEAFEKTKSQVKLLGEEISKSAVFNTKFRLGLKDGIIEEIVDVGLSNIVIRPSKVQADMQMFLQVLLANAMSNVKAGNLRINVFDPNGMGQDVIELYDQEYEDLFRIKDKDLNSIVKELADQAKDNMKKLKSQNINEFNECAEKEGRVELDYQLLLVLSQPKTIEEDEALSNFMTYSARLGVFVWMISKKTVKDTFCFETPFEGVEHPYSFNIREFGKKFVKVFIAARKKNNPPPLPWPDFIKVLCPEDKMWTYCGDDYVDIDPGFEEGDPDKYGGVCLGNKGGIHALAVGRSGGGKSVFLNSLIANMCQKYPPTDLQLWLIDYKAVEFGFYLPKPGQEYTFPHIKACLCTTDGDYAESVYAAFSAECDARQRLFTAVGQKNLGGYNRLMERNGTPEKRLPRIIFINDEFQVIFEKAQGKILDSISKSLTNVSKVGRSSGCHLFFTSQSMRGTVKGDVLNQFSVRMALKCAEELSTEIIGTKRASDMKEQYGFVIVSNDQFGLKDAQKKYKVPFLDDKKPEILLAHMKKLWDEAEKRKMPRYELIQYDEEVEHSIEELKTFYTGLKEQKAELPESGLIILGNRMTYSMTNRAPENIILSQERGSSVFSAFMETVDIVDFYKQILVNLYMFPQKPQVFVNAQVDDLGYVCEVEKTMTGEFETFGGTEIDVFALVEIFTQMYSSRAATGDTELPAAYFILIGWEAAEGFGVNRDARLMDKMVELITEGGEYNMHFIFICRTTGGVGANVINACTFHIAGACDERSSYALLDTKQGSQPSSKKDGFLYLKVGNDLPTRAKLYISPKEREIKKKTFVM